MYEEAILKSAITIRAPEKGYSSLSLCVSIVLSVDSVCVGNGIIKTIDLEVKLDGSDWPTLACRVTPNRVEDPGKWWLYMFPKCVRACVLLFCVRATWLWYVVALRERSEMEEHGNGKADWGGAVIQNHASAVPDGRTLFFSPLQCRLQWCLVQTFLHSSSVHCRLRIRSDRFRSPRTAYKFHAPRRLLGSQNSSHNSMNICPLLCVSMCYTSSIPAPKPMSHQHNSLEYSNWEHSVQPTRQPTAKFSFAPVVSYC